MTKSELVHQVAEKAGLSSAKANEVVTAVFETMTDSLGRGEEVRLAGFGTFRLVERRERVARHPRTGERIVVPAGRRVVFAPSSHLSAAAKTSQPRQG